MDVTQVIGLDNTFGEKSFSRWVVPVWWLVMGEKFSWMRNGLRQRIFIMFNEWTSW